MSSPPDWRSIDTDTHGAYQAMLKIGKAQRTLFVARYLLDRDLQRRSSPA